jgi:phage baseplate assembly protein W
MSTTDRSFLGRGWTFPPTFRREWYGVELLSDAEDVKSSIHIILSTLNGERVMLPTFGCNLLPAIFQVMNVPNIALIEKVVREALIYHEPRIIVGDLTSEFFPDQGLLQIDISFTIIVTNTRTNYVFPFYVTEATNIEKS